MQIEELNKAAFLQRIEELEREVRDLRHQLDVKKRLEEPPKNKWDKVSKAFYQELT